ncbi:MAG: hypothetical protein RLZZ283_497 [Candidatus Parcubacteria bacterium]
MRPLIFTLVLALALVAVPAHAANLIANPSLESGTTIPTGWSKVAWPTTNKATFTYPSAASDGLRGAKVQVTTYKSGDVFWMPPTASVVANTEYTWSGQSKSTIPITIVATYTRSSGGDTYETLGTVSATTTWTTFSKKIKTPANATGVRIQHIARAVGTLEIDNYSLVLGTPASSTPTTTPPIPPTPTTTPTTTPPTPPPPPAPTSTPPNLIQNGTLEAGGSSPTGWSSNYWGTLTAAFSYPATGQNGRGAKVTVSSYTSGDAKWSFYDVPVSDSSIYRYSHAYISDVPTSVTIAYKKANGQYLYAWVRDVPASPTWSTYTQDITVPLGVTGLSVLHSLSSVGTLTLDNASLTALPANPFPEGMITFVFDDAPKSVYENARAILNAANIKATHPAITNFVGTTGYMTWTNLATLKSEGNEIDSHTRTHPDLTTLTPAQLTSEVVGSFTDLVAHGTTPTTFVYPLGGVSDTVKAAVKNAGYKAARGSYFGLNTPSTDRYALFDQHVESDTTIEEVQSWIDQAKRDKRWLILELHEQKENGGQYSNTPAMLQSIVNYVKSTGIKAVTLHQGSLLLNQ